MDDTSTGLLPEPENREPGWYPDPEDPDSLLHWNGTDWSDSLFDDVTSVAVVESHDPELFLDEVDQPPRVALPNTPPVAPAVPEPPAPEPETAAAPPAIEDLPPPPAPAAPVPVAEDAPPPPPPAAPVPVAEDAPPPVAEESEADLEPVPVPDVGPTGDTWDVPRRGVTARLVIAAACLIGVAAVGVLVWQLLANGGDESSDSAESVAVEEASEAPTAAPTAAEPEPSPEPTAGPVEASPSSASEVAEEAEEPARAEEPPPGPTPAPASPLPEFNLVELQVDSARVRAEPRLDAQEVAVINRGSSPVVNAVGIPEEGWRLIEGFGGWTWGAFVAPGYDGQIVARTLSGGPAVLRDEAGVPTGAPSLGGSHVLIVDDTLPFWQIVLPEGGFAYIDGAEFELIQP